MTLEIYLYLMSALAVPAIVGAIKMWLAVKRIDQTTMELQKEIPKLRDLVSDIGDEVHDLHDMHDSKDQDGVYRWWFPHRLPGLMEKQEDAIRELATNLRLFFQTRDRGEGNGSG